MAQQIKALLVSSSANDLMALKHILQQLVKVTEAGSCAEARRYLSAPDPPHLVFTDTALADGTWLEVLKLAREAAKPVNVIVIARQAEVGLYIEAMETGAFDFITFNSSVPDLAHVVRNAADNILTRRGAQSRLRPPQAPGSAKRKRLSWNPSP